MTDQYIAYIEDKESGPFDFEALSGMALSGQVTDETQVRTEDSSTWWSWRSVREGRAAAEAARAKERDRLDAFTGKHIHKQEPVPLASLPRAMVPASTLQQRREDLRGETAYPAIRGVIILLITLSVLSGIVSLFLLTDNTGLRIYGICGLISVPGQLLAAAFLNVLLDIADAGLKKLE